MVQNIYPLFLELPRENIHAEFKAIPLSSTRKDFLAKNVDGSPVFLLHDSSAAKYNPGISFRHLLAQFHVTCRVQTDTADIEDQFCLVWCDATAPELHELFVRCVAAAIEELPSISSTREIESFITKLRDLFRALALPSRREVSGLWAELFVILKCGHPEQAMNVWHEDKFDRFDFSSSNSHIEVKSTVRGLRAHEFALEQLQPPAQGEGFVVSLLLQPLSGGSGILDLAREIEVAVTSPRLKQKLWQNVAIALGSDFSDKLDKRFDENFAERGLVVYSMTDIPKPDTPADPRITSLRFVSDLTTVTSTLQGTPFENLVRVFAK